MLLGFYKSMGKSSTNLGIKVRQYLGYLFYN